MNHNMKGMCLAVLGASLWGLMGIPVRALSACGFSSCDISFIRCLFAGFSYLIFCAVTKPEVLKVSLRGLATCLVYGVVAYSISFVSYSAAVSRISVAVATVLMFMSPIWVGLLGILVFHEKVRKDQMISIAICIVGGILVSNVLFSGAGNLDMLGIFLGLLNGFGVALQILIPRYFSNRYAKETMLVYGFLGAALALAPMADFTVIRAAVTGPEGAMIWGQIIFVGIFCTMVANVSFVLSANYIPPTTASILSAFEVVVSVGVGFVVFYEKLVLPQSIGAVIVVCGTLLPGLLGQYKKKQLMHGRKP